MGESQKIAIDGDDLLRGQNKLSDVGPKGKKKLS